MNENPLRGTTVLSVRRDDKVVIGGDGQVTLGDTRMKGNARKVRRLHDGQVLAGFAGGTADAFTLFERFEGKLQKHQGNLLRSAVELAKDWRTDRMLRRLEAMLAVAVEPVDCASVHDLGVLVEVREVLVLSAQLQDHAASDLVEDEFGRRLLGADQIVRRQIVVLVVALVEAEALRQVDVAHHAASRIAVVLQRLGYQHNVIREPRRLRHRLVARRQQRREQRCGRRLGPRRV